MAFMTEIEEGGREEREDRITAVQRLPLVSAQNESHRNNAAKE
jgi:hypothetical protein